MNTSLQIAFFCPDKQEAFTTDALFSRSDITVTQVNILENLREYNRKRTFDALILAVSTDTMDVLSVCNELASIKNITRVPLITLLPKPDLALLQSIYAAGSDVVLFPPFDPELLYQHIAALVRRERVIHQEIKSTLQARDNSLLTLQSLDGVPEGLILLDAEKNISHLNLAFRKLLGIATPHVDSSMYKYLAELFKPLLTGQANDQPLTLSFTCVDETIKKAIVTYKALQSKHQLVSGYVVTVYDIQELHNFSHALALGQRTRSLALLTSALALQSLTTALGLVPLGATALFMDQLRQSEPDADLNAIMQSLLEVLDMVITPGITLKVNTPSDIRIKVPFGDAFQILGFLILHAVELAGSSGETIISAEVSPIAKQVTIVISSTFKRSTGHWSTLLDSSRTASESGSFENHAHEAPYGLDAAQIIADRYESTIAFKETAEGLKLRVRFSMV